jgi:hypothetical protein
MCRQYYLPHGALILRTGEGALVRGQGADPSHASISHQVFQQKIIPKTQRINENTLISHSHTRYHRFAWFF